MINYNDIAVTELNTSSFSEIDRNSAFVFSYSETEPEPIQDGIRILAEADENTFLQLAERALNGSDYEGYTDTLYIPEQLTVDCRHDRNYVLSFEMAMYFGNSPEEAIDNLMNDKGNSVPLTLDEQEMLLGVVVDYAENFLNKDIDELVSEQENENEFELDR